MSAMSDAFESEIINYFFRNQALTFTRTQMYVALSTATVSETATGASMSEVTGTGYSRQTVTFGAPSPAGVTANTGAVTFTATGGDWTGPILSMYIVDSSSGAGNVLVGANITSVSLGNGDSLTFPTGDIDITMS